MIIDLDSAQSALRIIRQAVGCCSRIAENVPEELASCAYYAIKPFAQALVVLDLYLTGKCDRRDPSEYERIARGLEGEGPVRFRLSNPNRTLIHVEWPGEEDGEYVTLTDSALKPSDLQVWRQWRSLNVPATHPDLDLPFDLDDWR